MARRVGAIDIGTNTVLLLVAEAGDPSPVAVLELATITRLGAGVDRERRLSPDAMARTVTCLEQYRHVLDAHGVDALDVVCTSAARDAQNGDDFLDRAERALAVRPRIVDGDEEARLTFEGALTGLETRGAVIVFDVGGGSTEIIRGSLDRAGATIAHATSLDIGSVRLTERHVRGDPPTPEELAAIREDIARALAQVAPARGETIVGVAGTVTTLASLTAALPTYDSARVHGSRLGRGDVEHWLAELARVPLAERRRFTGLEPARADVIVAGTALVLELMKRLSTDELLVSDRGVRWGLARRALGPGSQP